MSCDWERYATPRDTRSRVRDGKVPTDYGVIVMRAGAIRTVPEQDVEHTPKDTNRAHSDIFGPKDDEETRQRLWDVAEWVPGFEP